MTTARQQTSERRPTRTIGFALVAALTALPVAPGGPASSAAADTDPPLTLIEQPFAIDPDGTIELTTQLADTADLDGIVSDGTIIVTSHRPLSTRTQVADARAGSLPNVVDTIDITPRFEIAPVLSSPVPGEPIAPEAVVSAGGVLSIRVPTETLTRAPGALQFAQPGIHPVVVEVRRGDTTEGVLVTFIDRLATVDSTGADDALDVGLVIASDASPSVDAAGAMSLDTQARTDLSTLAVTLAAAADAIGEGTAPIPALVDVDPTALDLLAATDPTVFDELRTLLRRPDLTSPPAVPLDPATAVAARQADTYRRLVDRGTSLLTDAVPGATPQRSTAVVRAPIDLAGAELLASAGTSTIVLPYDGYELLEGSIGLFTDTTRAAWAADTGLRAMVTDPYFAPRLADPGADAAAAAVAMAAEIVVISDEFRRSDDLAPRLLLLGTTDLTPPDAELLRRLLTLLSAARGVRLVPPVDVIDNVGTMLIDGAPLTVGLPDEVPAPEGYDPATRAVVVDSLRADATAVASMLPADDERPGRWATTTDSMASTVVTDDLAASIDRDVRSELDEVRGCIVAPERFSFTLTGRTSTIPFQISNVCDVPIVVRIQLDSPKISFPEGEQLEELAPGADTEVRVKAVARSNGRSSVFLRLLTPTASGTNQAVAPEVVLTARVQSLAGIGQLLLGTLVLVVLAWWLRQWRARRRQALLAANAQHHPAAHSGP